jgi:thiol-disulfide isomerase/thioredoxin
MATRKKYNGGRKSKRTARKLRRGVKSTSGRIYPPLDVRSKNDVSGLIQRITTGPITIMLVYADWCGHCHTMLPPFNNAAKSKERLNQVVTVNEKMLPRINSALKKINQSASINPPGFPTAYVGFPDGSNVEIPNLPRDEDKIIKIMNMEANPSMAVTEEPITEEPIAEEPIAEEPIAEEPIAEEPVVEQPMFEDNVFADTHIPNAVPNAVPNAIDQQMDNTHTLGEFKYQFDTEPENETVETNNTNSITPIKPNAKITLPEHLSRSTPSDDIIDIEGVKIATQEKKGGGLYSALANSAYTIGPSTILLATAGLVFNKKKSRAKTGKKGTTKALRRKPKFKHSRKLRHF